MCVASPPFHTRTRTQTHTAGILPHVPLPSQGQEAKGGPVAAVLQGQTAVSHSVAGNALCPLSQPF